jgi:hypothetical protein
MEPTTILSPNERNLLMKTLTPEGGPAGLEGIGAGWAQQKVEQLAFRGASGRYVQNLMPVLQAQAELAPRTRSGEIDIPAFRSSLEAIVPRSAEEVPAAQAARQQNYRALIASSGPAIHKPDYEQTLGADSRQSQGMPAGDSPLSAHASSGGAPAAAIAHLKSHPELAPQFKAKYGYLPQ